MQATAATSSRRTDTLVLQFDVNKTLVFGDTVKGIAPEDELRATFPETFKQDWDKSGTVQSFANFLRKFYGPTIDREELQNKIQTWEAMLQVAPLQGTPEAACMLEAYRAALATMQVLPGYQRCKTSGIFPSFFNLIDRLNQRGQRFVVVLHSFGNELEVVASQIAAKIGQRVLLGRFENKVLTLEGEAALSHSQAIFDRYTSEREAVLAIRHDYQAWSSARSHPSHGKPIVLNAEGEHHTLFADDMANAYQNPWSIACPWSTQATREEAEQKALDNMDAEIDRRIFLADPCQAMTERDYFIGMVNRSLEAHGRYTL